MFGNVGTIIAFRIGYTDAAVMSHEFGNAFTISELAELGRYEAIVKLLENGSNVTAFRGGMLPPIRTESGRKEVLVELSRMKFSTPRAVVDAKIRRWMD